MRCFLTGFAGFAIAALAVLFASAGYSDYSARASLSKTLAIVDSVRTEIAMYAQEKGTLKGSGLKLESAKSPALATNIDYLNISPDGVVVFRSKQHGQIIVYVPSYEKGAVGWKCIGSRPDKYIPPACI